MKKSRKISAEKAESLVSVIMWTVREEAEAAKAYYTIVEMFSENSESAFLLKRELDTIKDKWNSILNVIGLTTNEEIETAVRYMYNNVYCVLKSDNSDEVKDEKIEALRNELIVALQK